MSTTKIFAIRPRSTALGQLLVAGSFITTYTLQQALSTQRQDGHRLGDILVKRRDLSELEKQTMLNLQEKLIQREEVFKSEGDITQRLGLNLGQLLLDSGEITHQQLDSSLAKQIRQGLCLGEILIEQQLLTPIRLAHWLQLQKKLIRTATVTTGLTPKNTNITADKNERNLQRNFISGNSVQGII
ncbi:hypothetical protein [Zhongshania marina]|uniref:Uncharacterized protein n=1 Tax=Zhongshania marina TaxID=2304603 RepID=A0ABX9W0G0_9GAMM|nr:hypothetical protein D0911_13035 [Zhongshania marina]